MDLRGITADIDTIAKWLKRIQRSEPLYGNSNPRQGFVLYKVTTDEDRKELSAVYRDLRCLDLIRVTDVKTNTGDEPYGYNFKVSLSNEGLEFINSSRSKQKYVIAMYEYNLSESWVKECINTLRQAEEDADRNAQLCGELLDEINKETENET